MRWCPLTLEAGGVSHLSLHGSSVSINGAGTRLTSSQDISWDY